MVEPLSLRQTLALIEILENPDYLWSGLENFIAVYGYDESEESDLDYEVVDVSYGHRKIAVDWDREVV